MSIFSWKQFKRYEQGITGTEEELICRHFEQWWQGHEWDQLELSAPEANDRARNFRAAWILARMFTDDKQRG